MPGRLPHCRELFAVGENFFEPVLYRRAPKSTLVGARRTFSASPCARAYEEEAPRPSSPLRPGASKQGGKQNARCESQSKKKKPFFLFLFFRERNRSGRHPSGSFKKHHFWAPREASRMRRTAGIRMALPATEKLVWQSHAAAIQKGTRVPFCIARAISGVETAL